MYVLSKVFIEHGLIKQGIEESVRVCAANSRQELYVHCAELLQPLNGTIGSSSMGTEGLLFLR